MTARITALLLAATAVAAISAAGGAGRGGAAAEARSAAGSVGKLGFELRETKEELKLDYDIRAQDNGGNRVSVTFTLADEGRIKPITQVKVAVPSADKSGYFDVVANLAPFEKDGKKVYVLQLTRDLTERGEIDLVTSTMDGKRMVEWAYHRVPLAPALKAFDDKARLDKTKELEVTGPKPATTTEKKP